MKAALLERFGEPLTLAQIAQPVPGPGQILVRVEACGLCHSDLHLARGEWEGFKPRMPMPLVLGHEVAGRVAGRGSAVQRLKEGDAVGVAWFHYTCGSCDYCRRDLEVFCDQSQITGVTVHGGFAEYVLAWESHATPIPESLPPGEAAPLFCAGGTVFSALSKVKLDGSTHLGIWGAGGLGQYGIQLGKFAGSRVTAVDLSPSRLELARSLGADAALGAEEATEWFGRPENRVNVALVCASSAEAYRSAFQALQKNGVLLIVGIPSAPLQWTAGDLIRSGVRIIPSRVASRRELSDLVKLAQSGVVRSETVSFPLQNINDAIRALAAGEIRGRAVIHPDL
jgi:alcohol dehydrogenase, propanol-preferring